MNKPNNVSVTVLGYFNYTGMFAKGQFGGPLVTAAAAPFPREFMRLRR